VALSIPVGDDPSELADWAELRILTVDEGSLSDSRLNELLRGSAADLAEEEFAENSEEEEEEGNAGERELALLNEGRDERDVRVEQIIAEIELRHRLGPSVYPFSYVDDRLIRREVPGVHAYVLLLVLASPHPSFRGQRRAHEVEAAFDNLAVEALRRYLGRGAEGIRFARNAHDPEDNATRPEKFRDAIEWLRARLVLGAGLEEPPDVEREVHWEDEEASLQNPPLNSYNDAGVDVVVWWRFKDDRVGSPVLLAQCTVQLGWGGKTQDISVELWKKWINFQTVPPQTALVIPFAVRRDLDQWANRTVTAGVIIDRLRLLELLAELPEDHLTQLPDGATRSWVESELSSLA
jgi:hypothetical protein